MSLTAKQSRLLHVVRRQLGLADDDYRAILWQEAGVESSKDLDAWGLEAVLRRFEALGFEPTAGAPRNAPELGWRLGMASPGQVAFIRSLWRQYTKGEGDDRSLGKWLERTYKVSALRFLTYKDAGRAITALRAMVRRPPPKRLKQAPPAA